MTLLLIVCMLPIVFDCFQALHEWKRRRRQIFPFDRRISVIMIGGGGGGGKDIAETL